MAAAAAAAHFYQQQHQLHAAAAAAAAMDHGTASAHHQPLAAAAAVAAAAVGSVDSPRYPWMSITGIPFASFDVPREREGVFSAPLYCLFIAFSIEWGDLSET